MPCITESCAARHYEGHAALGLEAYFPVFFGCPNINNNKQEVKQLNQN